MWFLLALCSAVLLGFYDIAKKQSLGKNGVLYVLVASTAISTVFLIPFMSAGPIEDHLKLVFKAVLVSSSWISGLAAMERLPLTITSSLKASRPVFVLVFSLLIFGERLSLLQWVGVIIVLTGLFLLAGSSRKEGIHFTRDKGIFYMAISIASGVASALFDKAIMRHMEPMFVQSWCDLYITVLMAVCILLRRLKDKSLPRFRWDWTLVLIAVLITAADACYFFSLKCDGALLSVISITRRCSVAVTFAGGAILYKEKNLKMKAADLAILLLGTFITALGTL